MHLYNIKFRTSFPYNKWSKGIQIQELSMGGIEEYH